MNPGGSGGNSGKGEKWLLIGTMEPIARGLGLPLPSLGLGFGFGFGATLAGGRAKSLELEEATSCDACAFTRVDAASLALSYFISLT